MREAAGTSPAPAWLDLPEKSEYWTCTGTYHGPPAETKRSFWKRRAPKPEIEKTHLILFYTKEDAEAFASLPNEIWTWNGEPAVTRTLSDAMFVARKRGNSAVAVASYQNGAWVTVKEYPAGVPLREGEGVG